MSLSMYESSIGVMSHGLKNLAHVLDKAAGHGDDPAALIGGRLAPDMLPLSKQVQIATDAAKGCAARLAGVETPSFPDTETTFPELQDRIAKTLDYLAGFTPEQFEGAEARTVTLKVGPETSFEFNGRDYLLNFATPNFYFHVTTAYAIARAAGVELGKRDFLGPIFK